MPRGNYWEMTFQPEDWAPETVDITNENRLAGVTGLQTRRIVTKPRNKKIRSWHVKDKHFDNCDFEFDLDTCSFTNCTFHRCRFLKLHWNKVKFSNCKFTFCNFSFATFSECDFLDSCQFDSNSASAEHLSLDRTAISASAFIQSISTNLNNLPAQVDGDYQRHRLFGTKEKLAQAVFSSTRNEANIAYYFQAYKELLLASLRQAVERRRYSFDPNSRASTKERDKIAFIVLTLPARLELWLAMTSGWLTNWGQSVVRAMIFFVAVLIVFSMIYYFTEPDDTRHIASACMQAFDISIVAGYTAHRMSSCSWWIESCKIGNVAFGLYWYSLVIPTIVRRVLR